MGAIKTTRMDSFPQVLVVNLRRFELVDWVPAKLSTRVALFADGNVHLQSLHASAHVKPNEELLPQDTPAAPHAPVVDPNDLAQLLAMGFPHVRSQNALIQTKNQGVEVAMNWLIEHLDDPNADIPPGQPQGNVSLDLVNSLCDMGFTAAQARKALLETHNNMERAVEWLFSHPDDTGIQDNGDIVPHNNAQQQQDVPMDVDANDGNYVLRAIVSHRGTSVHCGHYVAHARLTPPTEDDPTWVLFNDEKVMRMTETAEVDDMISKDCYVVFLERT